MNANLRHLLLLGLLTACAAGCTAESGDDGEDTGATEDELRSLQDSTIYGKLRVDMEALRLSVNDTEYRGFEFQAQAGQEIVAYAAAAGDADPMAYLIDAQTRLLKRNDNRKAGTKDAEIRYTPTRDQKLYLVFRTKQHEPAPIIARIVTASSAARTGTYLDGWRMEPRNYGETTRSTFQVMASGDGKVRSNGSGCPQAPFTSTNPGTSTPTSMTFKVNLATRQISTSTGITAASAPIADDGSFSLEKVDTGHGTVRASGRVAAGGFVLLDEGLSVSCNRNYASETVFNASQLESATGATDTN